MENKTRFSREALYIQMAQLVAKRSTCNRMSVGAVLTFKNRVISTGYNGPAKDEPHCNSELCNKDKPCTRSIHAEYNALKQLDWELIDAPELVLYSTHQPCLNCAVAIFAKGICRVYYLYPYRNNEGLLLLIEKGIKVIQINEEGEAINQN